MNVKSRIRALARAGREREKKKKEEDSFLTTHETERRDLTRFVEAVRT